MKKIGVMLMLALLMCGATSCILGEAKPPYMVDRSEGWEFSFPATAATSMETFYCNDGFDVWRELLVAQPVEPFGRVEETQVETFAERRCAPYLAKHIWMRAESTVSSKRNLMMMSGSIETGR